MEHRQLGQGGRALRRVALALLLLAVAPGQAAASLRAASIMEDPVELLQRGPERQLQALTEMRALGVDTVRSQVPWSAVAGTAQEPYPDAAFAVYDSLVRNAHALGLKVLLTPTGPVPPRASDCANPTPSCGPEPAAYAAFVRALGERYAGDRDGLPRVDRWSLWNEPNLDKYLTPQQGPGGVVLAARRYRALARAGVRALRTTGHGRDTILLGETAPVGHPFGPPAQRSTPPAAFVRALLCVGRDGRRTRSAALGCRQVRRLGVSGYAHHPYTQGAHSAPFARPSPGQLSLAQEGRLERLLDAGARAGTIPRRLGVWWTEFGYQTDPPDTVLGVSLTAQAEFLNLAEFLAVRNPRVRALAQYQLVDARDPADFQSGLRRFNTLREKPAYAGYRLPLWVQRRGSTLRIYGRARPARGLTTVMLQRSARPGAPWRDVQAIRTRGPFLARLPYRPGAWRLRWDGFTSRAAIPHRRP